MKILLCHKSALRLLEARPEYAQLQARLEQVEDKLMAWHRADECSRRLAKIPGVGPIGASMLEMKSKHPPKTAESSVLVW